MIEQIKYIENAIEKLEFLIKELRTKNEHLLRENKELRSLIDDRDLEILQLQEDESKKTEAIECEKSEVANRLQGLLGRMNSIVPEEKEEQNTSF